MQSRKLLACSLAGLAWAQFPPEPEGITILQSKLHENITISYKEPGICETTPGVRSYAGYIRFPSGTLNDGGISQDYPINTFFWFFESRKDPANAPLTLWFNGGPGYSSILNLLEENGPCRVGSDSKSTVINQWSWNNEVNMLYIDQPNQVGFSYDVPTNGSLQITVDADGAEFFYYPENFTETPQANLSYYPGTFASGQPAAAPDSVKSAATIIWHFVQTWLAEFPGYKPINNHISLWTEGYGGHFGPGFFQYFQDQNQRIDNGSLAANDTQHLHLDTLGILNGLIDLVYTGEAWYTFGNNNTYGIQVFNETVYDELLYNWTRPGGCKGRVLACQEALKSSDWEEVCGALTAEDEGCGGPPFELYNQGGRAWYDIAHPAADPFPPPYLYGYLMEESVLGALGVPVNFSKQSLAASQAIQGSLDVVRGDYLEAISDLLDNGVKVHLLYGDRDYSCNWVGGEATSLAVPYRHSAEFAKAGYAPLETTSGVDGMTRQYGNFSFTRVFQAGQEIPAYQPEAAYEIFMRATFHRDIPSGLSTVTDDFATAGPGTIFNVTNELPEVPAPRCNVLKLQTCVSEVIDRIINETVIVKDWFVVGETKDQSADGASGKSSKIQEVLDEL
ncbi:carboxypeptidase C [Xylariaceae sp. FL0662B]|nr:carboxypeptidase C [Xylariaceae sp. FL0662B]